MAEEQGEEGGALPPEWETAVFGRTVELFLESEVGTYIIERAKADLAEASERLIEVDPYNEKEIAKLQLNARVAQKVRQWLAEAIENGKNAAQVIKAERDEHGT